MLEALLAPLSIAEFEERFWEQHPLLIERQQLPPAFASLLQLSDLPALSARLQEMDIEPQIVNDGMRCEPRELLRDFIDGGSAIINRVDLLWESIGRLCRDLRADFLHVFAVLYLTPRGCRAVPAHSDDQDVFILQLAGRKMWNVYGAPVQLPYTHEQLGKKGPIPPQLWETPELSNPVLSTELTPGSLLYLPRGAVHVARASPSEGSLHITLTVQSSDLNWRTFIRDGLIELHRKSDAARRSLPLIGPIGGWKDVDPESRASTSSGTVASTQAPSPGLKPAGQPAARADVEALAAPLGTVSLSETGSSPAGPTASEATSAAKAAATEAALAAFAHLEEVTAYTAANADLGFDCAMRALEAKLTKLNHEQERSIERAEALTRAAVAAGAPRGLPRRLCTVPGVEVLCGSNGQLVCHRGNASLELRLPRQPIVFLAEMASRQRAFAPSELPGADAFEQVAVCSHLLALGVLCDCDALVRSQLVAQGQDVGPASNSGGKGGGGGRGGGCQARQQRAK